VAVFILESSFMDRICSQYGIALPLLAILFITTIVYWLGLTGGFLFDDTINITDNPKVLIDDLSWNHLQQAMFSFGGGGLKRPISMLSLGLNHALTGLDPFYFKLTNLIIHLLCGLGLWLLTRLLLTAYQIRYHPELNELEIAWLSLAVSAAWLLHPFNLTGVLYIVQRMASLTALFMVFGLVLYVEGRLRQLRGQTGAARIVVGVGVFGALAVFCKENGILLPLLVLITEYSIFGFQAPKVTARRFVVSFNIIVAIIPSLLALGFLVTHFNWVLGGYDTRNFTLSERLLTEARVVWFYIQMVVLPDIRQMGLYHDDIILSKNWLEPITTLPAILGILALLIGAMVGRRRAPLLSFGILFFLVGHLLESTVIPLEIAHEHRNYLPDYGLLLVIIYYLGHSKIRKWLSLGAQIGLISILLLLFASGTAVRASYWANDVDMTLMEVQHHPGSARANMQAGYIFFLLDQQGISSEQNLQRARYYFEAAQRLDDYALNASFALLALDDREQRPIPRALMDELTDRLAHRPLASSSINALLKFSQCQNQGPCQQPPEVLNRLLQAIMQNPSLRGRPRAQVLTELAQFAISQNEWEIALYATQQALAIDSNNPQIYLNQANILIHLGEFDAARQAIEEARQVDRDAFFASRIHTQKALLEQTIAAAQHSVHPPTANQ